MSVHSCTPHIQTQTGIQPKQEEKKAHRRERKREKYSPGMFILRCDKSCSGGRTAVTFSEVVLVVLASTAAVTVAVAVAVVCGAEYGGDVLSISVCLSGDAVGDAAGSRAASTVSVSVSCSVDSLIKTEPGP